MVVNGTVAASDLGNNIIIKNDTQAVDYADDLVVLERSRGVLENSVVNLTKEAKN